MCGRALFLKACRFLFFAILGLVGADAHAFVRAPEYSQEVFQETCSLGTLTDQGFDLCSATLIEGGSGSAKIVTAAHCPVIPFRSVVMCECRGKGQYGRASSMVAHTPDVFPNYFKDKNVRASLFSDIQVATLISVPECSVRGRYTAESIAVEPAKIPESLEHAERLLENGDCYFAGYGTNNDGGVGIQHAVHVPTTFSFEHSQDRFTPSRAIRYWSARGEEEALSSLQSLFEKTGQTGATADLLREKIAETQDRYEDLEFYDPYFENSFEKGDSGGSLVCFEPTKIPGVRGPRYLVGVLATLLQTAVLINDPVVNAWFEKARL